VDKKLQVYAVLRIDSGLSSLEAVVVKEILPSIEEANAEVERLAGCGKIVLSEQFFSRCSVL
jgi:hypothetical protein